MNSYTLILILFNLFFGIVGCQKNDQNLEVSPRVIKQFSLVGYETEEKYEHAKELSLKYCSSCHLYSSPHDLRRDDWPQVLREMGSKMGVLKNVKEQGRIDTIRPDTPMLSLQEFEEIREYYLKSSNKEETPQPTHQEYQISDGLFKVRNVDYFPKTDFHMVTMVEIDEARGLIWRGLSHNMNFEYEFGELEAINSNGQSIFKVKTNSAPVDIDYLQGNKLIFSTIGSSNYSRGKFEKINDSGHLYELSEIGNGKYSHKKISSGLVRPIDINVFRENSKQKIIVSEFGPSQPVEGRLSIYNLDKNNKAIGELYLDDRPGSTKTISYDFNYDGKPDFLRLISQHYESLELWINEGEGKYRLKEITKRPPTWGYIDLEIADFNLDQVPDIVTINGDNMSYKNPGLKPYHSISIHLGSIDEKSGIMWNDKPDYSFPLHGGMGIEVQDFDMDGYLDIAAVAINVDENDAIKRKLIFLMGDEGLKFSPKIFVNNAINDFYPLRMSAGDIDGDGDKDIVIGGMSGPYPFAGTNYQLQTMKFFTKTVILENILEKK